MASIWIPGYSHNPPRDEGYKLHGGPVFLPPDAVHMRGSRVSATDEPVMSAR